MGSARPVVRPAGAWRRAVHHRLVLRWRQGVRPAVAAREVGLTAAEVTALWQSPLWRACHAPLPMEAADDAHKLDT
jgi:hypothetical protein